MEERSRQEAAGGGVVHWRTRAMLKNRVEYLPTSLQQGKRAAGPAAAGLWLLAPGRRESLKSPAGQAELAAEGMWGSSDDQHTRS